MDNKVLLTKSPNSLEPIICEYCGENRGYWIIKKANAPHNEGIYCSKCGRFWKWIGKDKRRKSKKVTNQKALNVSELCAFCGIPKEVAKEIGRHFSTDHILAIDFDGKDDNDNLWRLCSHCHYLKTSLEHITRGIMRMWEKANENKPPQQS